MFLSRAALLLAFLPAIALAQRDATREALLRAEETLALAVEEHSLTPADLTPVLIVSAKPAFEETRAWFPTEAQAMLLRVFGAGALRACEACLAPRVRADTARLEANFGDLDSAELIRLDDVGRGAAAPARTAIWLDETPQGVSLRLVALQNSRLLFAENFDGALLERARTRANVRHARELERRARGDSLTHTFIDVALYPGQHVSLDWVEQWGEDNANLAGITVSLFDPVVGIGICYDRVIPQFLNLTVGAQVLVSVPTAIVQSFSQGGASRVLDPLLTGVFVARFPLFNSNWALTVTLSTNLRFGLGFSLLNVSLLPFLP